MSDLQSTLDLSATTLASARRSFIDLSISRLPAASQNSTPSPLEPSTGKRKPCKKESDVWEHFEKYDLVLDMKAVDGTKRKEVEKRLSASIVVLLMLVILRKMALATCGSI
ncbi:hypothetical protein PRUPE_1G150700 [Prunus persica]|uniref:Uncharacterized protein n=1 Tax=Prunus persica TaxID=3760 RepID=A0A251QXP5_PRUPE|nr:hypothetical protein PRUPE_1G150700 [Prunus persica]